MGDVLSQENLSLNSHQCDEEYDADEYERAINFGLLKFSFNEIRDNQRNVVEAYLSDCTATKMIPIIEMIPATEMTPNHHRSDPHYRNDTNRTVPLINFRNPGSNGLGTLLSTLNSSFIHANTILNRGKYF